MSPLEWAAKESPRECAAKGFPLECAEKESLLVKLFIKYAAPKVFV
jgi:hypothetical protein